MTPFEIALENGPHACVVRLQGDVDIAVVPELRAGLGSALDAGCSNVVLDLSRVVYADSSALGLLVWLDHRLRPAKGKLVLAGANRDVGRILELSGLVNVAASIAMSANVEAALEGLDLPELAVEPLWSSTLSVEPDVNSFSDVREQASRIVEPLGFPESSVFDIKVALGEALANAVRHGTSPAGDSHVDVTVTAYDDRIVIEVSDRGVGFDGSHVGSSDVYAPSGRGIMFMRALMDRVEFVSREGGGTTVRLVKHRSGEAG